MIFNSIRWRVQLWHGVLLVLILASFGYTAYHVARDNQMRRVDEELERQMMLAFRPGPPGEPPREPAGPGPRRGKSPEFRPEPGFARFQAFDVLRQNVSSGSGQTNSFYAVLWQDDGSLAARSANAPADVPRPEREELEQPELPSDVPESAEPARPRHAPVMVAELRTRGEFREAYRFLPIGERCLLVGRSVAPELAGIRRLAGWLFVAGSGVLLLGLAGGWWLASRAIRPIEDISATAVKITAGDLSQRINAADTDSELGRLAEVLNSTFARLERAFDQQARFTSDASHELRTPVSVILSQTQSALSRERSAPEYQEALEACQRAAQRMRRLIESLLELARLDAGHEPMQQQPVDLSAVARECVELVRPLAAERQVEIRCELSPLECNADPGYLGQVVTNLLSNAIQYNRSPGEVQVSTRSDNGSAVLTIADTGIGIPAADLPHIFERFYRVDKSRSGPQGRTGLGLSICKAIVEAHGGAIKVTSEPGVGSKFEVRLPALSEAPHSA